MEFIIVGDKDTSKDTNKDAKESISKVNKAIDSGKHVFLMFFSNGCPPCEASKPNWDNLNGHSDIKNKENVVVARIEAGLHNADNMGATITGVPTFRYIKNKQIEELKNGETKHFVDIINEKAGSKTGDKSDNEKKHKFNNKSNLSNSSSYGRFKSIGSSNSKSNSSNSSMKGGRKRRRTMKRKKGRGGKNTKKRRRRR